jgi:dipeptidase
MCSEVLEEVTGYISPWQSILGERYQTIRIKGSQRLEHNAYARYRIRTVFAMLASVIGKQFSLFSSTVYSSEGNGKKL